MADTSIPTISFKNDLTYDVVVYDSFDDEDSDDDAQGNFFGTLTSLGTVSANATVDIQPIHRSSAFIIESATDKKPVKRCTKLGSNKTLTSFEIAKADEDAMTATFQFVDFYMKSPNDATSKAFTTVLNGDNVPGDMNTFFQQQSAYANCTFQTYMMAVTYIAITPASVPKPPEQATYSLSKLAQLMGAQWPSGVPDIEVANFKVSDKNNVLDICGDIDISTLPFETPQISSNVSKVLGDKKILTFKLIFNHDFKASITGLLSIFGTRLSLSFDTITVPAGNGSFPITKPQITIDINPLMKFVVFTLTGTIPFNLYGKAFDANLSMTIDNVEAAIGAVIAGDNSSLPAPPFMKGVHFDQFGIGMGIIFTPPAFAVGLQGKFHIGESSEQNVDLADDTFAIICQFESEIPQPVYGSFYVPQLDLNQALALFTNTSANLDVPVTFTDLSFRWAENLMEPLVLPDGSLTQMDYGFSAGINVLSFAFYGDVEVNMSNGLTANVQMSPLNWSNVFMLSGDGPGVTIKVDSSGNPIKNNQIQDSKAMQDALATAQNKQLVAPGGPVLAINTFTAPILHLNAKASLFELANFAIEADIDKSGIKFLLDYGTVLKEKMAVTLSDFHNLAASFAYYVDTTINVPVVNGVRLGSFHLAAETEAHLAITTNTSDVVISVGGSFNFEGLQRNFGDFSADIHIKTVSDLIGAAVSYIESQAQSLFNDFLGDAQKWAEKVKNGFLTGADAVGSVLKNAFGKQSQEVAAIMKNVGYDANAIGSEIKNAWGCGVKDVSWALQQVGYDATTVANSVKNSFGDVVNDTTNALKDLGYAADQVAKGIQNAFGMNDNQVASAMKQAGYGALDIANAIKNGIGSGIDDVASALDQAGFGIIDVASAIKDAFGAGLSAVKSALSAAGYGFLDIAKAVANLF